MDDEETLPPEPGEVPDGFLGVDYDGPTEPPEDADEDEPTEINDDEDEEDDV